MSGLGRLTVALTMLTASVAAAEGGDRNQDLKTPKGPEVIAPKDAPKPVARPKVDLPADVLACQAVLREKQAAVLAAAKPIFTEVLRAREGAVAKVQGVTYTAVANVVGRLEDGLKVVEAEIAAAEAEAKGKPVVATDADDPLAGFMDTPEDIAEEKRRVVTQAVLTDIEQVVARPSSDLALPTTVEGCEIAGEKVDKLLDKLKQGTGEFWQRVKKALSLSDE
jgi:hypothetical protein